MYLHDILTALPLGILLAFTIGPVFFVLLETSITKGFRAAMVFDFGVVLGDFFFILVAYFSTNQILQKLKDDPGLFIFGGVVMLAYGIISFIKDKKTFDKNKDLELDEDAEVKNNYLSLFLKGFLLNFINIGVLGFWMGVILVFSPKLNLDTTRISIFFSTIIIVYLLIDVIKISIAKQLKSRLTPLFIYKIKRVISVVLIVFGLFLIIQGFFPDEKEKLQQRFDIMNTQ